MDVQFTDSQGSGAFQYLRLDLFPRPAIHNYMPAYWVPPGVRCNNLSVAPVIVVTSTTRHLTLTEQLVLHAALRRSAKLVSRSMPHA